MQNDHKDGGDDDCGSEDLKPKHAFAEYEVADEQGGERFHATEKRGGRTVYAFEGKGVLNLFIALGLLTWVRTARMIRASVMQLKEKEYIEASRACGASTYWIIMKGLVPNCLSTIIVLVTLGIPNAIMYEASLSFLGIGIQPPTPSWGNMISAAQTFISYRPVYSIMPGVAIMITVIAFNIFGDGLRDALDPKLRG